LKNKIKLKCPWPMTTVLNCKLIEKQKKIKMSMAYDCHSIPADSTKEAVDEGVGNGNR